MVGTQVQSAKPPGHPHLTQPFYPACSEEGPTGVEMFSSEIEFTPRGSVPLALRMCLGPSVYRNLESLF